MGETMSTLGERFSGSNLPLTEGEGTSSNNLPDSPIAVDTLKLFTEGDIRSITNNYEMKLGEGGYGIVYKGILDGKLVAVKKALDFTEDEMRQIQRKQFDSELKVLAGLKHENIIGVLGYCSETDLPIFIYEFADNGSLEDILHGDKSQKIFLSLYKRIEIALKSAEALCYLHEHKDGPIVHGDFKPPNILLDSKFDPKVTDFGLSRIIAANKNRRTTTVKGTDGYIDPLFAFRGRTSPINDIYSFGVVLVEILTKQDVVGLIEDDDPLVETFVEAYIKKQEYEMYDKELMPKNGEKHVEVGGQLLAEFTGLNLQDMPNEVKVGIDNSDSHSLTTQDQKILLRHLANIVVDCVSLNKHERPTMRKVVERLTFCKNFIVKKKVKNPGKRGRITFFEDMKGKGTERKDDLKSSTKKASISEHEEAQNARQAEDLKILQETAAVKSDQNIHEKQKPKMTTMDPGVLDDIIRRLLKVRTASPSNAFVLLTESEIRMLCTASKEIFLQQPMLLELEAPSKICGDIHGQYSDLLRLFEYGGFPPDANYVFLGNYVDFGKNGIETICLLLAYKIKYPENFFLLRGNHECASVNRIYGFYDECKRRYTVKLWKFFMDCFNCLPVAALIDDKILCMHGGLSPDLHSLDQIRNILRPTDIPNAGLLCDLLWSDPSLEVRGWGMGINDEGVSYTFGHDVVKEFLGKHDLDLICRGNQVVEDGYEFFADRQLVTIFSAPNYRGEFDNAGAMMSLDETLMCSFQILRPATRRFL